MPEKTVKAKSCIPALDDTYPKIQKIISLLLDVGSCDWKEPQTTHLPFVLLDEERGLEMPFPLSPPSPLKMSSPLWGSNQLPSLSTVLLTLPVELLLLCYDLAA